MVTSRTVGSGITERTAQRFEHGEWITRVASDQAFADRSFPAPDAIHVACRDWAIEVLKKRGLPTTSELVLVAPDGMWRTATTKEKFMLALLAQPRVGKNIPEIGAQLSELSKQVARPGLDHSADASVEARAQYAVEMLQCLAVIHEARGAKPLQENLCQIDRSNSARTTSRERARGRTAELRLVQLHTEARFNDRHGEALQRGYSKADQQAEWRDAGVRERVSTAQDNRSFVHSLVGAMYERDTKYHGYAHIRLARSLIQLHGRELARHHISLNENTLAKLISNIRAKGV